jgi:hypothetical protein
MSQKTVIKLEVVKAEKITSLRSSLNCLTEKKILIIRVSKKKQI